MATAIVIDGAFFLRRFRHSFPTLNASSPKDIALGVQLLGFWHLAHRMTPKMMTAAIKEQGLQPAETSELYRVFFYDCPPLVKKLHLPVSGKALDLSKTEEAVFRLAAHREIQKVRKVALRLGRLNETVNWRLKPEATTQLRKDPSAFRPSDDHFEIDTKQKGVDMRLGLDVAAMAFKRQVNQIVLVAADADFVPAAKLARREGIDVVLDKMHDRRAATDLIDHVDGVRDCYCPHPQPESPKL
ncbi:MAG: hypothetical protein CNE89_13680 [Sphingomonadaceae bacterium MED-G03]|jgi:uncharacterized LabA/DUF88 family protein|nr:MAG: hypothetical protein CNE89_13680 [Sphingomonadaceae bacterium MED-G03]